MENGLFKEEQSALSLRDLYFRAIEDIVWYDDENTLLDLKERYPDEIAHFQRVGRMRKKVRLQIEALRSLNMDLYFGTLTFNSEKDANLETTKRREAFLRLNEVFLYFFLVEEYGEDNGRYHIHFVGVFRNGFGFDDFIKCWHSRQNLEKIEDTERVCKYMCKYVSKALPRLRRNKALVDYERAHTKVLKVRKMWCYSGKNNRFERELVQLRNDILLEDLFGL